MEDNRVYVGLRNLEGELTDATVILPDCAPEMSLISFIQKGYDVISREEADDYATKSLRVLLPALQKR